MPEHYSKLTVEVKVFCAKCGRDTMHNVNGGRRGACQECIKRLEAQPKPKPAAQQESLFAETA